MVLQSMMKRTLRDAIDCVLVLRLSALSHKLAPASRCFKTGFFFFFLSFMKLRIRDWWESSQVTTPNKWATIEYLPKCPKQKFGVDGGVRFAYHHSTNSRYTECRAHGTVWWSAAMPSRG